MYVILRNIEAYPACSTMGGSSTVTTIMYYHYYPIAKKGQFT